MYRSKLDKNYEKRALAKKGIYEIILFVSVILMLIPFLTVLYFSIKPTSQIVTGDLSFPHPPEWNNYIKAISTIDFGTMIKNTLHIAVFTLIGEFTLGLFGAYALSRFKIGTGKLQRVLYVYMIIGIIVPSFVYLYPLYKMNNIFGLINTHWAVILPYIGWSAPMSVLMLSSAFSTVPDALEEAAVMDGCGPLRLLLQVELPVIRSSVVTLLVINFLSIWNEFAVSVVMLQYPEVQPISLAATKFVGINATDYGAMVAAVVMLSIPQVSVFSFFQKYVTADLTAGSVKE